MKYQWTALRYAACLLAACLAPIAASAAGPSASVGFSAPATVTLGNTFQVIASVSGAKDLDTVRLNGTFSNNLLELQSMVPLSLKSISPGNFTNQTTGIYSFGAFSVSDRLNGRASLVALVFKPLKTGTATITLGPDSLLLSNGQTESASWGKISVNIVQPSPAQVQAEQDHTVLLTSPSHPEGGGWKSNRTVQVQVTAQNPQRIYLGFDRSPDGPANLLVSTSTYAFTADSDGVWYVHLGVVFADGTFIQKTLTVLIDTGAPRPIEPSVDQSDVPANVPNNLRFATVDDISGIDHYDVRISNGYSTSTKGTSLDLGALDLPPGDYVATVTAYDLAGNSVSGDVSFQIAQPFAAEVPPPTVQTPFDWIDWLYGIAIASLLSALFFFYLGYHKRRRARHK